jgi:DNA polymerase
VLWRDAETRSTADLAKVGAWKYAADPTTEVICVAYCVDNDPPEIWIPGAPSPPAFVAAAMDPAWLVVAHNAMFEMAIEQLVLHPRFGWPLVPIERQRCTMAMALALALPAKLEKAAEALELLNQKDKAGQRLMLMMSKPRRPRKDENPDNIYWYDDQDRLARLYGYARKDVEVDRELCHRLRPLSANEQIVWQLHFRINARGFYVDRELASAGRTVAVAAVPELDAEVAEITAGAVTSINQVARMREWLTAQGCSTDSLDKKTVEKLLEREDLAEPVRRVLELRSSGAQSAAKKITALLNHTGEDGRARGQFRYHGASTGRFSGNGFQPQNLKRPETKDIDAAIAAVSTGDYAHVRSLYEKPLAVIGDLSRSMICAAPGHVLIGADFSSIESRVLAWIAGEEWKLDAYRRFDAKQDPRDEVYVITAATILGKSAIDITADERRTGKTCDLAFGYMGGVPAFRVFESERFTDLEVDRFKQDWRVAHPKIKRFWYDIDAAAWRAVRERDQVIHCGRIAFKCTGAYLFLKLPSSRKLAYPFPRIEIEDLQHEVVVFKDNAAGQWRDVRNGNGAYGGLWTENIVSAISRDLLVSAMLRLEAAGYPIVLHVHDEIVCEAPEGFGSTAEFTKIMTATPSWALGLPIAAKAWTGPRFCK